MALTNKSIKGSGLDDHFSRSNTSMKDFDRSRSGLNY